MIVPAPDFLPSLHPGDPPVRLVHLEAAAEGHDPQPFGTPGSKTTHTAASLLAIIWIGSNGPPPGYIDARYQLLDYLLAADPHIPTHLRTFEALRGYVKRLAARRAAARQ